jgi:hypothetical protein
MRTPSRGLLLSVALHVTAAVLLGLRYDPEPRSHPIVMTFELVRLTDGIAPETGRDPEAPAAVAAPDNRLPGRDDAVANGTSPADDTGIDSVDSEELHAADADSPASAPRAPAADNPEEGTEPRRQLERPDQREAPREQPRERHERAAESPIELTSIVPDASRLAPSGVPEPPSSELEPSASRSERPAAESEPSLAVSEADKRELSAQIEEWAASKDAADGLPADLSSPSRRSTEWRHKGQRYAATFEELPAEDGMHLDRVVMSVSTEQNGLRLTTKLELKRLAFSSFAQFVDRWDPQVQIHDDRIDGRFHSNSEIVITKSRGIEPRFLGKVTTAEDVDTSDSAGHVSRKNVFLGGLETRVRRIALPRRFLPFGGDSAAERERVQRFSRDAHVTFYADGSYGWRYFGSDRKRAREAGPEERRPLPDAPYYLIAGDRTTLYVEGIVNGKVLIYSPSKIVIAGDLTYAADPAANTGSDDYLGLVSDGDVEIGVPELTGHGDLHLQASIYARHRFAVRGYLDNDDATLSLYGSLTAGSLSATEPRFRTKLEYDRRFEDARPPGFPMADRYEIAEWDERWTAESETAASSPREPSRRASSGSFTPASR